MERLSSLVPVPRALKLLWRAVMPPGANCPFPSLHFPVHGMGAALRRKSSGKGGGPCLAQGTARHNPHRLMGQCIE